MKITFSEEGRAPANPSLAGYLNSISIIAGGAAVATDTIDSLP
jgi:hypothetical protein